MILVGGFGTRRGNESKKRPKPMTEIGGISIICHIMYRYASFGISDFIVCSGHKGNILEKNPRII